MDTLQHWELADPIKSCSINGGCADAPTPARHFQTTTINATYSGKDRFLSTDFFASHFLYFISCCAGYASLWDGHWRRNGCVWENDVYATTMTSQYRWSLLLFFCIYRWKKARVRAHQARIRRSKTLTQKLYVNPRRNDQRLLLFGSIL